MIILFYFPMPVFFLYFCTDDAKLNDFRPAFTSGSFDFLAVYWLTVAGVAPNLRRNFA